MVEEIYELKNKFLEKMTQDIEERGGIERVNVDEMYKLADIVKDLAEAEKACWEAEYYRGVSEAMEGQSGYAGGGSGYPGGSGGQQGGQGSYGYAQGMGYPQGGSGGRSGGSRGRGGYPQSRDSMGRFSSRRGYGMSGYPMEELKMQMQQASPQEREQMIQELRQMLGNQMQ